MKILVNNLINGIKKFKKRMVIITLLVLVTILIISMFINFYSIYSFDKKLKVIEHKLELIYN